MNFIQNLMPCALVVATGLCLTSLAHADVNLVTNGDFETGDFTGWYASAQNDSSGNTGVESGGPAGSANVAFFGQVGSAGGISQDLATLPGQSYTLDFQFNSDGALPNEFQVVWDGNVLTDQFDLANSTTVSDPTGWVNVIFTGLTVSTTNTTLTFNGQDDNGYLLLDDVSVVPEPATIALLLGACSLGFVALRRRKARA